MLFLNFGKSTLKKKNTFYNNFFLLNHKLSLIKVKKKVSKVLEQQNRGIQEERTYLAKECATSLTSLLTQMKIYKHK